MISFLKTIIYVPLYNVLILILHIPYIDVGIATIILTLLVKLVLYPLSKKGSLTQLKMKQKEGELAALKLKYPNTEEQALKVMEFYKTNEINPFSSLLTLLIQIPVIYSLYFIFFKSGLPTVNTDLLYSFVHAPQTISMSLLGLVDVSKKNIILALLAGLSSFAQMHFQSQTTTPAVPNAKGSEDFSTMLTKQMKYTMPIIIFIISWRISSIVALYWVVSNVAGIIQDYYIKKRLLVNA